MKRERIKWKKRKKHNDKNKQKIKENIKQGRKFVLLYPMFFFILYKKGKYKK